jgi:hypothetical protein
MSALEKIDELYEICAQMRALTALVAGLDALAADAPFIAAPEMMRRIHARLDAVVGRVPIEPESGPPAIGPQNHAADPAADARAQTTLLATLRRDLRRECGIVPDPEEDPDPDESAAEVLERASRLVSRRYSWASDEGDEIVRYISEPSEDLWYMTREERAEYRQWRRDVVAAEAAFDRDNDI